VSRATTRVERGRRGRWRAERVLLVVVLACGAPTRTWGEARGLGEAGASDAEAQDTSPGSSPTSPGHTVGSPLEAPHNPLAPAALLPDPLRLPPGRMPGAATWATIASASAIALGAAIVPPPVERPSAGGVGLDESVRDAVRLERSESRYAVRDGSDVLLSLLVTSPFVVDAMLTAGWYRSSPEVASALARVDAEAMAITAAIHGLVNTTVGRERPYGRTCGGETPSSTLDCDGSGRFRSFFSGHAALSFTGASLICSHHLRFSLFGGGGAEVGTCLVAYAAAATTATFRVMADMHYATDVLAGAAVGTLVGLLVPALHFDLGADSPERAGASADGGLELRVAPGPGGLAVGGRF
jgi:membrane-associated phospholipid phosphatase